MVELRGQAVADSSEREACLGAQHVYASSGGWSEAAPVETVLLLERA